MEIINYVGYQNRKRNFFTVLKEKLPKFSRRSHTRDYSFGYSIIKEPSSYKSYSKSENGRIKTACLSAGKAVSFVEHNIKKILIASGVIAALVLVISIFSGVSSYSKSHADPLDITNAYELETERLNSIMAQFALDETFSDDFGAIDVENDQKIEMVFSQPVTFQTYKVQNGDTISGIAKKFGLKNISTLIAVNDINNVRQISSGQKLKIPSIDGLIYTVQAGNSIQSVAAKYKVTIEDLLDVNELESDKLVAGQQLFIPGAKLDNETLHNALGDQFKNPLAVAYRITSRFGKRSDPFTGVASNHTGVDMACPTGSPIMASMSGKVAKVGYSNIYGNYVIISHSKGYQTLYAHMSKTIATQGQWVTQGTKIGLVGSTGYSTGPHLHLTIYKNGKLIDPLTVIKK